MRAPPACGRRRQYRREDDLPAGFVLRADLDGRHRTHDLLRDEAGSGVASQDDQHLGRRDGPFSVLADDVARSPSRIKAKDLVVREERPRSALRGGRDLSGRQGAVGLGVHRGLHDVAPDEESAPTRISATPAIRGATPGRPAFRRITRRTLGRQVYVCSRPRLRRAAGRRRARSQGIGRDRMPFTAGERARESQRRSECCRAALRTPYSSPGSPP